jgi:hypothetical protein
MKKIKPKQRRKKGIQREKQKEQEETWKQERRP